MAVSIEARKANRPAIVFHGKQVLYHFFNGNAQTIHSLFLDCYLYQWKIAEVDSETSLDLLVITVRWLKMFTYCLMF